MGLNFPSAPATSQVFFDVNRGSFVYEGLRWHRRDGTALKRNRFVNGGFQISQQNGLTDGTNVAGLVMADQFFAGFTSDTATYRGQRVQVNGRWRARLTVSVPDTALVASDWLSIFTKLEGQRMADFKWGTAEGKWAVIRFGLKAPAGTYAFSIRNAALDRSIVVPFTVTAAQANVDTVFTIPIQPCTDSTWASDNSSWGYVTWGFADGGGTVNPYSWRNGNFTGYIGMSNGLGAAGVFELFDVGFYLDPFITGLTPPFETGAFEDDLLECQRYWYRLFKVMGVIFATNGMTGYAQHPVPMRTTPTTALVGTLRLFDGTNAVTSTGLTVNGTNSDRVGLNVSSSGTPALVVGRVGSTLADSVETNYISVNARM